ncbi:glycosyltransferase [Bacillus mobilis]|uniref:glycosyltransferase n=1 Tax=Bacillus mobilis TaxID=2026190 RepID=UPI000A3032A2|nr:glycosyltransferase [Bacillus mobilis]MCU5594430.1 glycosyltransferase [Bacillus mobilis]MCU5735373.1 glycosyltransferase [Bacillus mobilis]MCU9560169.1 glycosyltransferase [Bacillus mobilis]SMD72151.1 Putative teichuronic acid biosynthesis glycosyltransferase TuaC [Bacillus mobilis]HDR7514038.1 glycosyltransferase [Bacillus mobilis]
MNILIIPSWYPTEENPTAGIFFKEQAIALKEMGLNPIVIYPKIESLKTFKKNIGAEIVKNIEEGVPTLRLTTYNYLPKIPLGGSMVFWKAIKKLYKEVLKDYGRPDIIHAHSCLWAGEAARRLSIQESIPFVLTEHSSVVGKQNISRLQKMVIGKILNQSNHIISVGPGLAKSLEELTPNQGISIIPNIVDIDFFDMSFKDSNEKKFKFFSLALLNKNKGMDVLIKAFAKYLRDSNVELIIGGDGEEKANLERLIADLGISSQIKLIGALDRFRVKEEMQKCDSFVLASRYETFGVVFIEALACGRPIIATKCGGPEMIVEKNNGYLVEVDDIDGLGKAMLSMIKNINYYHDTIIRKQCIEKFSKEVVIKQIKDVYKLKVK